MKEGGVVDVGSGKAYPRDRLSNFSPHPFTFDGVECASMEGLLQAFKFDNPVIQAEVCKLTGFAAKKRGQGRNGAWKSKQTLWWKGTAYIRSGREYQRLLDRAYDALAQNESFQRALLASGNANLTHKIGKRKKSDTVLTRTEFCSRLMKIRRRLQTESNDRPGQ